MNIRQLAVQNTAFPAALPLKLDPPAAALPGQIRHTLQREMRGSLLASLRVFAGSSPCHAERGRLTAVARCRCLLAWG